MDENNLDPEQIRQLNEAFAELKEIVSSTTDNLKSNDLKTGVDKIKSSSEQIKNELEKFSKLLKNVNKNLENQPTPKTQSQDKPKTDNIDTKVFENVVKVLSGNLSGLNSITLNLIKSFGNLDELVKDKTGSKTKISERLRERTQQISSKISEEPRNIVQPNEPQNVPDITISPTIEIVPPQIDIAAPVEPITPASIAAPVEPITPEPVAAPASIAAPVEPISPVTPAAAAPQPVEMIRPDESSTVSTPAPKTPQSSKPDYSLLQESKVTVEGLQKFASALSDADKSILKNTGYIKDGSGTWKKYSSLMEVAVKKQELLIDPVDKQLSQLEEVIRNYGYIKDENDNWISTNKELTAQQREELQERKKVLLTIEKEAKARKQQEEFETALRLAEENAVDKQLAELENLAKSYGYLKDANGNYVSTVKELTVEQQKELVERKSVLEEIVKEGRIRKEKEDIEKARKKAEEDLIKNFKDLSNVIGKDLVKNLFDSSKGMGKYGDTFDKFGGGIIDVTKNLGPMGRAIGFVTGGLLKLVGAVFKQNEVLNKAYEELSTFGAVDFRGISQMFTNLQNAGFPVSEIEKFTSILKQAGPNLAGLGVTAADGAKKVADTFKEIKNTEVEDQLRMLGFTSETMFKTFVDYQSMLGRLGRVQGKDAKELAERSSAYAKTLNELAQLTGESRDSLQKQNEAIKSDISYRMMLDQLSDKEQDRVEKLTLAMEQYGEETGRGIRNLLSNAGPTIDEASNLYLQTGGKIQELVDKFKKGTITTEEFNYEYAKAVRENAKQLGVDASNRKNLNEINTTAMSADREVATQMIGTAKQLDNVNKVLSKSPKEMADIAERQKIQAERQNDSQRALEVARAKTERNFEQAKDRLVQLVGSSVAGAFEKLYGGLNKFGKALADVVYWVTSKIPGFKTVDFRDVFASADDIKENLDKTAKDLAIVGKELESINQLKAEKEKASISLKEKENEQQRLILEARNATTTEEKQKAFEKKKLIDDEIAIQKRKIEDLNKQDQNLRNRGVNVEALEKKRTELLAQQTTLQKQYEQKKVETGIGGEQKTSEMLKIEAENKKLQEILSKTSTELTGLSDQSSVEFKILKKSFLDQNKWSEEDLKDKEKNAKLLQAVEDRKLELERRRNDLTAKINKSTEELVILQQKENEKKANELGVSTTAPTAESRAGAGRGTYGMPMAKAEEGVEVATGKKSNMTDYLKKVAQVESSGSATARAGTSSASGLFQFTEGTWNEMTRAMGKNYSLQDRFDPVKSTEVAAFMTKQRKSKVEEAIGRETNDTDVYLSHFLGEAGAIKFLKALDRNPNALSNQGASDDQIRANLNVFTDKSGRLKTLQEVYDSFSKKLETAETVIAKGKGGRDIAAIDQARIEQAKLGGVFSGPESGYPVLLHGREIVIPMPDTTNIGAQLAQVTKTALDSATPSPTTPTINLDPFRDIAMNQETMIETLISKLDEMIGKLSTSNDIQDRILTYQQT